MRLSTDRTPSTHRGFLGSARGERGARCLGEVGPELVARGLQRLVPGAAGGPLQLAHEPAQGGGGETTRERMRHKHIFHQSKQHTRREQAILKEQHTKKHTKGCAHGQLGHEPGGLGGHGPWAGVRRVEPGPARRQDGPAHGGLRQAPGGGVRGVLGRVGGQGWLFGGFSPWRGQGPLTPKNVLSDGPRANLLTCGHVPFCGDGQGP